MKRPQYRIYPTLLDSYNYYIAPQQYLSEKEDAPTEDEISAVQFKELIDKINRVPYSQTEAQAKGSSFEEMINRMLDGEDFETILDSKDNIFLKINGFLFPQNIVHSCYSEVFGCTTKQERMSTVVNTPVGLVELYGVLDYTFPSIQVDLKTTSRYEFLKYKNNTQHKIYPIIARNNGIVVDEFVYLATDFRSIFIEPYTYSNAFYDEAIDNICRFVDFIEQHRHLITDKKIFGGSNDT